MASVCASTPCVAVDDEERALARREAARDLVVEVDVAGRVDEVAAGRSSPSLRRVLEADGLRLDGDAALALDVHLVEELLARARAP